MMRNNARAMIVAELKPDHGRSLAEQRGENERPNRLPGAALLMRATDDPKVAERTNPFVGWGRQEGPGQRVANGLSYLVEDIEIVAAVDPDPANLLE